MDLDESMDVFKKPLRFGRAPKAKSSATKKVQTRGQKSKPVAVGLPNMTEGVGNNMHLTNETAQTRELLSKDVSVPEEKPTKLLKVCPLKIGMDKNVDYCGTPLEENKDISQNCKTCGKLVRLSDFKFHVPACLRLNFEACRRASENSENVRDMTGEQKNHDTPGCSHESTREGFNAYFCPACGDDLSQLSQDQRNLHANRCLDHAGQRPAALKHGNKGKQSLQNCSTSRDEYRCLLCTKLLKSSAGLKKHFVACQKKNEFTTMTALTLHRPESGVEVDMEIMAEISKSKEQKAGADFRGAPTSKHAKKVVRKQPSKPDPTVYESSMLQLALAASKGEDLTSKRHKKQKEVLIPVMLTLSPNSKKRDLKERMRRILTGQVEEDNDIPSTPGLPKTALSISSIRAAGFMSGVQSNGTFDDSEAKNKGQSSSQCDSANLGIVHNHCQAQLPCQIQGSSTKQFGTTHRHHRNSPVNLYENELQSPEVSSSNIKSVCLPDASDSPGRTSEWHSTHGHGREVQCEESKSSDDTTISHRSRLTKWTMTNSEPNDPDKDERIAHVETPEIVPNALSEDPGKQTAAADNTLESDVNCTLEHIENLENSVMSDSMQCCNVAAKTEDSGIKYSRRSSTEQSAEDIITWHMAKDQSTSSSDFKAFLGNPLYSDAKLVIGQTKDELHVHKMILFYRCRPLLEEIEMSGNNTLFLPEYDKSAFSLFLKYIYTNKLETSSIFTGVYKTDAAMLTSIAQRFGVELPLSVHCLSQQDAEDIKPQGDESKDASNAVKNHCNLDQEFLSQPSPTQKSSGVPCPRIPLSPNRSGFDMLCSDLADLQSESGSDIFEMPDETSPVIAGSVLTSSVSDRSLGSFDGGQSPTLTDQNPTPKVGLSSDSGTTVSKQKLWKMADNIASEEQKSSQLESLAASNFKEDGTLPLGCTSSVSGSDLRCGGTVNESGLLKAPAAKNDDHENENSSIQVEEKVHKESSGSSNEGQKLASSHTLRRKRKNLKKCSLNCCKPDTSVDKYVKEKLPRFKPREFRRHPEIATRYPRQAGKLKRRRSSSESNATKRQVAETDDSKATCTKQNRPKISKLSQRRTCKQKDRKHEKAKGFDSSDKKTNSCDDERPSRKTTTSDCSFQAASCSKAFPMCDSLPSTNSLSCSKKGRKRSSEGAHKGEMVYVSERLPRFKQREHIRNRPGVANMGKPTSKVKKETTSVRRRNIGLKKESPEQDTIVLMSQPTKLLDFQDSISASNDNNKNYRFKRLRAKHLRDYASSTPTTNVLRDDRTAFDSDSDASTDGTGYISDGVAYVCTNDGFDEAKCDTGSMPKAISDRTNAPLSAISTCEANTPVSVRSTTVGSAPITPMVDFNDMQTPEIYRHAEKYGLKKCLGKVKLKSKFEEVYRYSHQTLSDGENMPETRDGSESEDWTYDMHGWKLELSPFSAKPDSAVKPVDVYSFTSRTISEVNELSLKVVEQMHLDGTLMSALQEAKQEMGSIKRGSRRDQERCWDIVTPGSSGYDPKMNAILSLSEEYHSAITGPLVNCVVKSYLEYKKYMFDCLPALCDRIEQELA